MSLETLGVPYAAFKRPDWALAVVAIAIIVAVAWESWETNKGNDRPVLNVAVGIMLSFLAGMSVERGIGHFKPVPEAGEFSEEVEAMLERTRNNPNAIIYGTFYSYPVM